ncbi:MAG: helix-turn-helix domain-containing protein [Clostridia bacterium]|nr:helix-turn-helix domain-containing protein [Clostridia bacterium]
MVNLSNFAETLSGLMFEHNNINGKALANTLGIAAPTITRYLRAERTPTVENLVLLADYFNCSVDFLLGLEEQNTALTFKPCPPFSQQLVYLTKYFKLTYYAFYHAVKIPESTFFEWKKGESVPTIDSIKKIADFFDCRVDFILGREN